MWRRRAPENACNIEWKTLSDGYGPGGPSNTQGEATKRISVYFALVNDGDMPVAPKTKIKSSKLLINGKVYKNWPNIVSDVDAPGGSRRVEAVRLSTTGRGPRIRIQL